MRFMMIMRSGPYAEAGIVPPPELVAVIGRYNDSLERAGVLLALDGLHPTSKGARVSFAGGKPRVSDGPFRDANGAVGGYWLIQARSLAEAVEWASRCPALPDDTIEVRQVHELGE